MSWTEPFDWAKRPFTYKYSQPREYRFSLDSIEFMWRLAGHLDKHEFAKPLRVLDLCAGCGVLGLEFNWCFGKNIAAIDFVEIQPEFEKHFQENLLITKNDPQNFKFHLINFNQLPDSPEFKEKYDLIICNPPYFRPETGSLTQSSFRNRCHFLVEANFESLCRAIVSSLSARGEAYVLLRDLSPQGVDQARELSLLAGNKFEVLELARIRGTPVVRVKRLA